MILRGLILLLLLPLAACAGPSLDRGEGADRALTVLAAASLTEAFTELAETFEAEHEGVDVALSFGSSTDLAETVADEAPGDVLATADQTSMDIAVDAGVVAAPATEFASNELVLVTAPGNPEGVASLDDLADVTWVRCADDVPCGRVALTLLETAAVDAAPASLEVDVRSTLEKVVSGEADAGLVYASDAIAAGDAVEAVPISGSQTALSTYLIAPLAQADDADLAADWVALVGSEAGRSVLDEAGFGTP